MRNYEVVDDDRPLSIEEEADVWLPERRPSWMVRNAVLLSLVVGITGLVLAVTFKVHYDVARSARTGELKVVESRIGQLRAEQAAHHDELEALQRSIGEARRDLDAARRQARIAECRATNARINAEIIVEEVSCYKQYADHHRCDANNQKAKADGSVFGALLGAGLAIATGGSAALAAGGALLGSSGSGSDECPAVQCELAPLAIERAILARHGLAARASCDDASRT
jgi:hypothetical protein